MQNWDPGVGQAPERHPYFFFYRVLLIFCSTARLIYLLAKLITALVVQALLERRFAPYV